MTASIRRLSLTVGGFVAAGLVLGCLSVEALTRTNVARAKRALPGALAPLFESADMADHDAALREAQRLARSGRYDRVPQVLHKTDVPVTPELHTAFKHAWMAKDDGVEAAHHAQLAARLAPTDEALAKEADRMVDIALAYRMRWGLRAAGAGSTLVLLLLGAYALSSARRRKHMRSFLDSVSGKLRFSVDGEPVSYPLRLGQQTESLTLDVFLSGRYGMACPRRPRRGPTMHVSCSHAGANETLRLTPVRHVCDSAVRIHMRDSTLRRLLARPGRWRIHVKLGDRIVGQATLDVLESRRGFFSNFSRRNGALST